MDDVYLSIVQLLRSREVMQNPRTLFTLSDEEQLWAAAPQLLALDTSEPALLRTFIRALSEEFEQLKKQAETIQFIQEVIRSTSNSSIFLAAQSALGRYAAILSDKQLSATVRLFLDQYRERQEDDVFFAAQALKAAVALPLTLNKLQLLSYSISVLVNEFPEPSSSEASVELVIAALKLAGRCYEFTQDKGLIANAVHFQAHENVLISGEASFQLGVMRFTDSLAANTSAEFFQALVEAQQALDYTVLVEENRTDAALLAEIAKCFARLSTTAIQPQEIAAIVNEAREILIERWYAFGAGQHGTRWEIERAFVEVLNSLERWVANASTLDAVPNIGLPLAEFARIYGQIRAVQFGDTVTQKVGSAVEQHILVPYIRGRFAQVQKLGEKLTQLRSSSPEGKPLTEYEEAFYNIIEVTLAGTIDPKVEAAARLEALRAAAEQVDSDFADLISPLLQGNIEDDTILISMIEQMLNQQVAKRAASLIPRAGPAHNLALRLWRDVANALSVHPKELDALFGQAVTYIRQSIAVLSNYALKLRHASREKEAAERIKFLFAEQIGGLGAKSTEQDLQLHCYDYFLFGELWPEWQGRIDLETRRGAPGRADLRLTFPNDTTLIIEFKAEKQNVTADYLRTRYIAQAQEYAAATHRIAFMLVLDLTAKKMEAPLRAYEDSAFVERYSKPGEDADSAVVVFVIPANRFRPSDASAATRTKGRGRQKED